VNQLLGVFGLLDFTMLRPFLAWRRFETYEPFIYLIFNIFSGRGKSRIRESADTESVDTGASLYIYIYIYTTVFR
jgi:hypothetical protein